MYEYAHIAFRIWFLYAIVFVFESIYDIHYELDRDHATL